MIKISNHCVHGKCYWNGNGRYGKQVKEMDRAGFSHTKAYQAMSRRYYRFYNDGDRPYRQAGYMSETEIANRLEADMDKRIEAEYKRFKKTR